MHVRVHVVHAYRCLFISFLFVSSWLPSCVDFFDVACVPLRLRSRLVSGFADLLGAFALAFVVSAVLECRYGLHFLPQHFLLHFLLELVFFFLLKLVA